jgi:hypothetical protein
LRSKRDAAEAAGWQAALIKRVGNDVLGSARNRASSAMTSMISPISSSRGAAFNLISNPPGLKCCSKVRRSS